MSPFFIILFFSIISQDEAEKTIPPPSPESTFTPSYHYQIYGKQQQHENAVISFRSPDNELTDREIKNNVTLLSQQVGLLCYLINNSVTFFSLVDINSKNSITCINYCI
jgi:hypothetical protein